MARARSYRILTPVAAVLICTMVSAGSGAQADQVAPRVDADSKSDRLQLIADQLCVDTGLPGLSIAVLEDGAEMVVACAGFADLKARSPVTHETKYFVGSVSKNLFATALLRLADKERISLEGTLSDYVEWPGGGDVTIKMLLNHTSGIPEYIVEDVFQPSSDGGIPEFFRVSRTPRDLIATLPSRDFVFAPGSSQEYSNTNGLLVGEVVCAVTGQSLADAFSELIVEPLELHHTYLYGESTSDRDRARGYSGAENWGAANGELVDCSAADEALLDSADGSVIASAGDLVLYHQALRQGELLSASSWSAMRTVDPGLQNGLSYLIAQGKYGPVEGNFGRAMGHVTANLYYGDHKMYVAMVGNRSDVSLPLATFLHLWLGEVE